MTGWHLLDDAGTLRGLAVLNIVPTDQGRTRTGKIVDCLLDDTDVDTWQAAMLALTTELYTAGGRPGASLRQHALDGRGPSPKRLSSRGSR